MMARKQAETCHNEKVE